LEGSRTFVRRALVAAAAAACALLAAPPALAGETISLMEFSPDHIGGTEGYGHEIDQLYKVILWIVIVTFVLTEGLLVFFLFRFRARPGGKAVYTHGNHRLEVIWTLVPGAILFWLAIYQTGTWRRIKIDRPPPSEGLVVEVMAKQFEWHFRLAGPDGKFGTADDVVPAANNLHVPVDTKVTVLLRSQDVLHSFFLPSLRLKQDTVPGMTIGVWFEAKRTTEQGRADYRARLEADRASLGRRVERDLRQEIWDGLPAERKNAAEEDREWARLLQEKPLDARIADWIDAKTARFDYEIACAELCGLGHTRMRGTLVVHSKEDFFKWLDKEYVGDAHVYGSNPDALINKFWPKTENKVEDEWLRREWPADLKAKWPKK